MREWTSGIAASRPEDIDKIVLASFGPRRSRIGPREYFDSCGLDLHEKVQRHLYPTLCNAHAPRKILIDNIRAGSPGQKSRRGLCDWSERDEEDFRRRPRDCRPVVSGRQWPISLPVWRCE